jgi:hypothetical protein
VIALTGHVFTHFPHSIHICSFTLAAIFFASCLSANNDEQRPNLCKPAGSRLKLPTSSHTAGSTIVLESVVAWIVVLSVK